MSIGIDPNSLKAWRFPSNVLQPLPLFFRNDFTGHRVTSFMSLWHSIHFFQSTGTVAVLFVLGYWTNLYCLVIV